MCINSRFLKKKKDKLLFYIKNNEIEMTTGDTIGIYELRYDKKFNLVVKANVFSYQYKILKLEPYKKGVELPVNYVLIQLVATAPYKTMERIMRKVQIGRVGNYCKGILNLALDRNNKFSGLERIETEKEVKKLYHPKKVDTSQKEVINYSLNDSNDIVLIHGPPGTGKTHTLVELIIQYVKTKKKILVTGFSNTAVNNIAETINKINNFFKLGVRLLRSGRADKSMASIYDIDLNSLIDKNPQGIAIKYVEENIHYMDLEDQYHVKNRIVKLNNKIKNFMSIMYEKSDVIFMTCATTGNRALDNYLSFKRKWFDLVIIDEASQALEAACWPAMILGKRLVISGDHNQLPPVIKSKENVDELSYTLFEKLIKRYQNKISIMLKVQYRMAQTIMEFSSKHFYKGELKAHESVAEKTLIDIFHKEQYKHIDPYSIQHFDYLGIFNKNLVFFDTSFWNYNEEHYVSSKFNVGEATLAKFFIDYLMFNFINPDDIGVITPYAAQVDFIKAITDPNIEVSSVDGFQGREKEVIIISFVRSNEKLLTGFLSEKKRINVSLTRAKKMVIIIGNANNLSSQSFLSEMVEFYKEKSYMIANKSFSDRFRDRLDVEYDNLKREFKNKEEKKIIRNLNKITRNRVQILNNRNQLNNMENNSFQSKYSEINYEMEDSFYNVSFIEENKHNYSNMTNSSIPSIHYKN
jgi:superfamily I DNA and/or RNA helicase